MSWSTLHRGTDPYLTTFQKCVSQVTVYLAGFCSVAAEEEDPLSRCPDIDGRLCKLPKHRIVEGVKHFMAVIYRID